MRGMTEERLTWHFENWAYWQRAIASDYGEGYSHKDSSGAECYGSWNTDDRAYDELTAGLAAAVGACLESVTPGEFAAVRHKHLEAVYRNGRAMLEEQYDSARVTVRVGLARRGID